MPTRADWEHRASTRIISILRQRLLCSERQLESKISEAGPLHNRPQPVSITDGLHALRQQGRITTAHKVPGINAELYALRGFNPSSQPDHKARVEMMERAYPLYLRHAGSDRSCGDVLEEAVHRSFEQSAAFHVIHSEITHGAPKTIDIGPATIDNSLPVDHVVRHNSTGVVLIVEDKNIREWFYPEGHLEDIAKLCRKAVTNNLTPFLVIRKAPYVSRLVFRQLGFLAFQTHRQYFLPDFAAEMHDVRHTDGLGFHDIDFSLGPIPHLVRYLDNLPDAVVSQYRDTFRSHEDLIRQFATNGPTMGYYEFIQTLGLPWGEVQEEAYDYEEFDHN